MKVWCVRSGHCLVTFSEHTSEVTAVQWTQGGKAVVSASLDGTVRAFDTKRCVVPSSRDDAQIRQLPHARV